MTKTALALFVAVSAYCSASLAAQPIRVAVASNFATPMQALKAAFEQQHPYTLSVSLGSSGKHVAQIQQGASFDIVLAADQQRPQFLEQSGHAIKGSRFTYAQGLLVLWAPTATQAPSLADLSKSDFLAIANPKLAPYGVAAMAYLQNQTPNPGRIVMGENVAQTYQFVASGHARMGLLALSQVLNKPNQQYFQIPAQDYPAILQQAVLLNKGPEAAAFMGFLGSENAAKIIRAHGYLTPGLE